MKVVDQFIKIILDRKETLLSESRSADKANRLAAKNILFLREHRLLSVTIDTEYGGSGLSMDDAAQISFTIGRYCLSTAICFSMHIQQIETLKSSGICPEVLKNIVLNQQLVASVTTDTETGSGVNKSSHRFTPYGSNLRKSPIVSYPEEADLLLISMKDEQKKPIFVLVNRKNAKCKFGPILELDGARGLGSHPLDITFDGSDAEVLDGSFDRLLNRTFVPTGHILWSASWLGLCWQGYQLYRQFVKKVRSTDGESSRYFNLALALGKVRSEFEEMISMTRYCTLAYERDREAPQKYSSILRANTLKISVSKRSQKVLEDISYRLGLHGGYLNPGESDLNKMLRDIRSASIMFHNMNLEEVNISYALIEPSHVSWFPILAR